MEIERFLEKLASPSPTPGGGSASALAGALSASLIAMVAGLSVKMGKAKEMEKIRKRSTIIQKSLFQAMGEDATSFDAVMKAFRFPKGTEKERLHRTKMIQKAYRNATAIPQIVCKHSIQLLEYSKNLVLKGNPNAISDAGVAAFLADTAFVGGLLNIGINLGSLSDRMFLEKMNSLMGKWTRRRNHLMRKIQRTLSGTHKI